MPKKLKHAVVVITGASSGIGKASARQFARKGAFLVLAARREDLLNDLVTECEQLGGQAIAVPVDTSNEDDVNNLAKHAIEHFGRIDVWINNAGVYLLGRFEETPPDAFRQVVETNLFGYVYGARAVLPHFREQGSGVLINNSSVFGVIGAPYLTAYVASKFAVRGFSQSLRQELLDEKNIHVSTILPSAIDTPIFQHTANYTGRAARPVRPIYDVEQVASSMVQLAERPRQEVVVGKAGRMIRFQRRFMPNLAEKAIARQVEIDHFQDEPARPTDGNVFEPVDYGSDTSGGWKAPESGSKGRLALIGALTAVPAYFAWRKLGDNGNGHTPEILRNNGSKIGNAIKPAGKNAVRKVRETLAV